LTLFGSLPLCLQDAATLLNLKRTGSREQLVRRIGDALRLEFD
jgi:hypothetical protein